jgi:hypothetical protein
MNEPIDPLAVARAIIADPRKKFTMSTLQIMAICKALVAADELPVSIISTDLADAIAEIFNADTALADDETVEGEVRREQAISAAKTLFETEFPDVRLD